MDQPQDDNKIKEEDKNITARPSGTEGEGSSTVDENSTGQETHIAPEIEKSVEDSGVSAVSQESLQDKLQEPIQQVDVVEESQNSVKNSSVAPAKVDEKTDITLGSTWLGALKEKFRKMLNRSTLKAN